jgi:hypothetical protein
MRKVNKTVIALSGAGFVVAAVALAQAQTPNQASRAPQVLESVYACAGKTNDAERLACYDAAVGALKTAQSQGEITAIDKAQAKALERESFGFNLPSLPKLAFPDLFGNGDGGQAETPTAEVSATITRMSGQSKPTFTLSNGQVWQSIDNEQNRNARVGGAVVVRRGVTGSFLMRIEAGGTALRVRRLE